MYQNQTFLQKLTGVLNASSTTFMLIALVSLFVIPIVIAQNLEPVLETSSQEPRVVSVYNPALDSTKVPESVALNSANTPHSKVNNNVLGTADLRDISLFVKEDQAGMKALFATSNLTVGEYSVNVINQSKFNKTKIYTIRNVTDKSKSFTLDVVNRGDPKNRNSTAKTVYLGETAYEIGKSKMPVTLTLAPSEEIVVSVASPKTNPTNLSINLVMQ